MTEDNDKRGPPPTPPKEGSVKQMTEDNDKRGPPPAPPKEGEVGGCLFVNNFPYTVFQHIVF